MAKRYLGRTTELTTARLEEVAAQLAEAALLRTGPAALAQSASHAEVPDQHVLISQTAPLRGSMAARRATSPLQNHLQDVRLATKLHKPRLRTKLVHRARLLKHLGQGIEATLTFLPAGGAG